MVSVRFGEIEYEALIGSDIKRDGMFLEVADPERHPNILLEIFYSDQTHQMTFTGHRASLPLELVEWSIEKAKERLVPISQR